MGSRTREDPDQASPEAQARGGNESLEHRPGGPGAGHPGAADRAEGEGARGHPREEQTHY